MDYSWIVIAAGLLYLALQSRDNSQGSGRRRPQS
jgi:hypothetical protein